MKGEERLNRYATRAAAEHEALEVGGETARERCYRRAAAAHAAGDEKRIGRGAFKMRRHPPVAVRP